MGHRFFSMSELLKATNSELFGKSVHTYAGKGLIPFDSSKNQDNDPDDGDTPEKHSSVLLKTRPKTKKPSMYKVLLLNDDYTSMDFVVHVLERFFNKNRQEATDIMLHVHRRGVGVCGIYTYEVAETKVTRVMDFARANEQPLQCTMEKE